MWSFNFICLSEIRFAPFYVEVGEGEGEGHCQMVRVADRQGDNGG